MIRNITHDMIYDRNDKILTLFVRHGLRALRYVVFLMMMVVGVNGTWGATITYHIINLGRLDDNGALTSTRTEALQFTTTETTVGVPDKYKSPLAKNWQYYSSSDVTYNSSTKVCVFNSGPSLSVGDALSDGAHVYVTYELDEDALSTVNLIDGGISKIKFDETNQYLQQTVYNNDPNTGSFTLEENSTFYWKVNIKDPYQITIQSQSTDYPDWYLSADAGKFGDIRLRNPLGPEGTNGTAKKNKVWAFGLLPGGSENTYRLIVTDGYTYHAGQDGIDQFGHGYLNNNDIKNNVRKTRYQKYYDNEYYNKCDLTFESLSVNYNFHIINNSGEEAMSAQISSPLNAGAAITESMIPAMLKSPAVSNYSFYPTLADATAGTNAVTRLPIGADVYVRYETSGSGIYLNGELKYKLSVGGEHHLFAANATTISSTAASSTDDTYKWMLLGGDPYQFTIKNKDNDQFITYDVSGGEAVPTLSATGSKFFLHQSTSGKYELVAVPSNNYPTSYYTLGYDGTYGLKLYSNTNYSFEAAEIQTVFTPIQTAIIDPLPTANNLTYNGSEQALVTAGMCEHGTIKYREGTTGEYTTTIPQKKDAGTYDVYYMSEGESDDYEDFIAAEPITVTIAPAPVTVTAEDKTKVYGETDPSRTATITGLIPGELESLITYTLSRAAGEDVGNYTITPNGDASQGNYAVSFETGKLTISKKTVGLTWGETTFYYNGTPQVPTATATGLVYSDVIDVKVTGEQTNVGNYTATASNLTGTKAGNYKLPAAHTTLFSIFKASINTSIVLTEWSYGDYDDSTNSPSLSYNPDNQEVTYLYKVKGKGDDTYDSAVPTDVGTYTVKASLEEGGNSYAQVLTKDFTITPKALNKDAAGSPANGITVTVLKNTGITPHTYNVTVTHNIQGVTTTLTPYDAEHPEESYDYTLSGESSVSGYVVTITAKNENGIYTGKYTGFAKAAYPEPTFYQDGASWSLSEDEYAAVYLGLSDVVPNPVESGSEIKAYIVNNVNPTIGTVTVSPVEYISDASTNPPTKTSYIPEDVPVLLLSNKENLTGFPTSSTTEDTSDITTVAGYNNQLRIAPEGGVPVEDTEAYVFYRGEFVLTKEGTISPGKFFLYNPNYTASPSTPSPRRFLRIVVEEDEDPTGIDNGQLIIDNGQLTMDNDIWYTLDGRRLDGKPTRKGIYITNGKKIYFK